MGIRIYTRKGRGYIHRAEMLTAKLKFAFTFFSLLCNKPSLLPCRNSSGLVDRTRTRRMWIDVTFDPI